MTVSDAETVVDRQPEGEWVDARTAMLRLNIAERTLHRRIASGKLQKRFRQNGQIEVWIAAEPQVSSSDSETDTDRQDQAERALALVERVNLAVNQQVTPLLELVERQQEMIREQAERLGRLSADLELARASLTLSDKKSDTDRQPWWRRWFAP
jgi:hypothetical protein